MLYPYKFKPILVERLWGGSALTRYGKAIPAGKRIGESWEISDRADAQSVVANGPDAGQTLHQLIQQHGAQLLGANCRSNRFPLIVKLLDARDRLSLQVHPPATLAALLGGEPKTEMWYILDAMPDALLIAGLRRGTTRQQFEAAIKQGGSAFQKCFHQFSVRAGDALFVPSGRLHAIGAGLVIAEIQQNSDTTYRAYDWDRVDDTGKPRPLHIRESLASIDFNDFEPVPTPLPIKCEHFVVEQLDVTGELTGRCDSKSFQILGGVTGNLRVNDVALAPGEFVLLPATLGDYNLTGNARLLRVSLP
ncbi:MAG: type I phosphomannose isomerase catalytic subunit [Verrucomicrobiota bacterium]|jgi:mannose-6-phosphate isomerase